MQKIFAFPILCRLVFVSFVFSSIAFPVYAKLKIAYIDIPPFAWQDTQKQAQGKVIDKFIMVFSNSHYPSESPVSGYSKINFSR